MSILNNIIAIDNVKPIFKTKKQFTKEIDELSTKISELNVTKQDKGKGTGTKKEEEDQKRDISKGKSNPNNIFVLFRIRSSENTIKDFINQMKQTFKEALPNENEISDNDFKLYDITLSQENTQTHILHCNGKHLPIQYLCYILVKILAIYLR